MAAEAPINPTLVQAMVAALEASAEELDPRLRAALTELLDATLLTTADPFPAILGREDGDYAALFTDLIEFGAFAPSTRWRTVRAEEILRRIADEELDGLVVYGGGRRLTLSADDVHDFFELDD